MQDFGVPADLHFKLPAHDDVAFLSLVRGQFNVPALRLFIIGAHHIERLGNAVLKRSGEIVVYHAVRLFDALSRAAPGHGIRAKLGAAALDDVGDIYAERQRAAVNKSKIEVADAALAQKVFLSRHISLFGHLLRGKSLDFAQFPDARRHLSDFVVKSCNLIQCPVRPFGRKMRIFRGR